jgi:RNA polymerase sigma-70 factor (ECF subfamily)
MDDARRLAQRCGHDLAAPALADLARLLEAGVAAARERWPELGPHDAAFADALAPRLEGEAHLVDAVARLALPDIYLVTAVLAGDRGALAAFERLVRDETTRAVARLGPRAPAAEDVIQELLVKLLVTTGDRPAKLSAFGGHGALHAWLKVAAVRTAISLGRRKQEALVEDDALAAIADDSDDQALAFLKSSYRGEFKTAFAATFAELPRRSRTLLRLQIIDHLSLEEVGAFYSVSRATAARWLADARSSLVTGTQQRLVATLSISADELAELMRLVASSLYATLPRLIRHTEG